MQESILYIVLALLCVVIYLLVAQKKSGNEEKNNEELGRLKDSLTSSISTMSSSFNSLSKDVTRDMTQALTKVDEKVGVFNQQVEALNKGQQNFSRILAGVKQYGGASRIFFSVFVKRFTADVTIHSQRENQTRRNKRKCRICCEVTRWSFMSDRQSLAYREI